MTVRKGMWGFIDEVPDRDGSAECKGGFIIQRALWGSCEVADFLGSEIARHSAESRTISADLVERYNFWVGATDSVQKYMEQEFSTWDAFS